MEIFVCVKQVPSTNKVQVDDATGVLKRDGVASKMNPYDLYALETALRMKEAHGGRVTVGTMGPPQAKMALREALSMGCDDAILISARQFSGSDTLATSTIISAALTKIGYDLIITGRQAIDGDTAQVGPQIAEHLNVPQVSYVQEVELDGDSLIVLRQYEDRYHKLRVKLPCLLTAIKELAEPRYMTISGIVAANLKEVTVMDFDTLSDLLDPACIGLKGSPTKVVRSFTKEPKSQGALLKGLSTAEAVDAIMARMYESHLI